MEVIARWETRGRRYWLELRKHGDCDYRYASDNGGGCLVTNSDSAAIYACEERVQESLKYDNIRMKRVR